MKVAKSKTLQKFDALKNDLFVIKYSGTSLIRTPLGPK